MYVCVRRFLGFLLELMLLLPQQLTILLLQLNQREMTEEEHSDSRTEDDYEEGDEAYDDEGTLDEEEMLQLEENYQDELKLLEDDANLSIEELRQKYCNTVAEEEYDDSQSSSTSNDTRKSEGTYDTTVNSDFTESGTFLYLHLSHLFDL
ncbi:unnamed protein product [Onchocerca flexuosa]|uniref:Nonsense-mediated mRNA decay protein 2-like n=1 Tax=Onchocerca flexuosa TaxID=387005 RepID=A0A183HLB6_9BILA|nr:unnamed protein product [Onchocerca flexuosa]